MTNAAPFFHYLDKNGAVLFFNVLLILGFVSLIFLEVFNRKNKTSKITIPKDDNRLDFMWSFIPFLILGVLWLIPK